MKNPTSLADRRKQAQRKSIGLLGVVIIAAAVVAMTGKNKPGEVSTGPQSALSENDAMADCQASTRQSAKFPSSVNFSTLGGAARTGNDGTVTVRLDFEAKNGFGNLLPQRATCIYPPSGPRTVSIEDR
ncbi:hypothetical protein LMG3410_04841 [Achromobacter aegrifaciens]|uniref:hypothetical protein n=1 Tax=Achromobacter aegrifaciens TaxID=1287736 RepID=UPI0014690472|nr:hypothetical protein [Achromobacter aegrifaciens]CAB3911226.1 hypothetical protein LMG3410_04841 [Achromobacter aegrifaciens]